MTSGNDDIKATRLEREHDYTVHSSVVTDLIARLQPRNGTDYSTDHFRAERERIAVNVWLGNPVLEEVR